MSRLTWADPGERFFEIGVDRGVLYVGDDAGVAWNGLISVDESPQGGDADEALNQIRLALNVRILLSSVHRSR